MTRYYLQPSLLPSLDPSGDRSEGEKLPIVVDLDAYDVVSACEMYLIPQLITCYGARESASLGNWTRELAVDTCKMRVKWFGEGKSYSINVIKVKV